MIAIAKRIYDDVEVRLMDGVGHSPHFESPMEANRFIYEWVKRKTQVSTCGNGSIQTNGFILTCSPSQKGAKL